MNINKYGLMGLMVGALVIATSTVTVAAPPPPPPGMVLRPGMVWCPRCGGCGRVPSGFMGWNEKRCPECKGVGMLMVRPVPPPPPPPPPPPAVHHHPAPKPAVHHHPAPKPVHHAPAPKGKPAPKGGHKGGPGPR